MADIPPDDFKNLAVGGAGIGRSSMYDAKSALKYVAYQCLCRAVYGMLTCDERQKKKK